MSCGVSAAHEHVFQFKITLRNHNPIVWRRVLVPKVYNFKDLHDVIMALMEWDGTHLYDFKTIDPRTGKKIEIIGEDNDGGYDEGTIYISDESTKIAEYFVRINQNIEHEYDYTLNTPWKHDIVYERLVHAIPGQRYPQCIAGEQKAPPEPPEDDDSDEEEDDPDEDQMSDEKFDYKQIDLSGCRVMVLDDSPLRAPRNIDARLPCSTRNQGVLDQENCSNLTSLLLRTVEALNSLTKTLELKYALEAKNLEQKLELEKRKTEALEKIAANLEAKANEKDGSTESAGSSVIELIGPAAKKRRIDNDSATSTEESDSEA